MRAKRSVEERFWAQVDIRGTDDCWERSGAGYSSGYAVFKIGPRNSPLVAAHRFAYTLCVGPIPEGLWVLHHCDNRRCVNPKHLFVGTHTDNMRDMFAKGRRQSAIGGGTHGTAKLTPAVVAEIRASYKGQRGERKYWCDRLGIHPNTFNAMISGRTWRHVA